MFTLLQLVEYRQSTLLVRSM